MQSQIDALRAEVKRLSNKLEERPYLESILQRASKLRWEEQEIERVKREYGILQEKYDHILTMGNWTPFNCPCVDTCHRVD